MTTFLLQLANSAAVSIAVSKVPNFLVGETTEQAHQRVMGEGVAAGLSLFNEFYLAAMVVCLLAIFPATLMFGSHGKEGS